MGRWLTRDPIGYGGGENLYEYCDGDSVNALDEDGLQPPVGWKKIPQDPMKYVDDPCSNIEETLLSALAKFWSRASDLNYDNWELRKNPNINYDLFSTQNGNKKQLFVRGTAPKGWKLIKEIGSFKGHIKAINQVRTQIGNLWNKYNDNTDPCGRNGNSRSRLRYDYLRSQKSLMDQYDAKKTACPEGVRRDPTIEMTMMAPAFARIFALVAPLRIPSISFPSSRVGGLVYAK